MAENARFDGVLFGGIDVVSTDESYLNLGIVTSELNLFPYSWSDGVFQSNNTEERES